MIRKTIAAVVAGIALAMAPVAASAYVPVIPGGVIYMTPGVPVVIGFAEGTFVPGESVSLALTGENATGATLAGVQTFSKDAEANGSVIVTVTLPEDATGTYTLTATQGEVSESITLEVEAEAGAGGDELSDTGAEDNTVMIAAAAGLLVLGAGAVVVATRRRTNA
jgi:LPXTG-motif cell wall-anchored protein